MLDAEFGSLRTSFVRALGTYLKKWRPAAPPALIGSFGRLWQWVQTPGIKHDKWWLHALVQKLEDVLNVADNEVRSMFNFSHDCRLFNLRNPKKPGVPRAPTYKELTTGKTDPRHTVCDVQNVRNAREITKDLLEMEIELLSCTGKGAAMLEHLLKREGLATDAHKIWQRCNALRHRRLTILNNPIQ